MSATQSLPRRIARTSAAITAGLVLAGCTAVSPAPTTAPASNSAAPARPLPAAAVAPLAIGFAPLRGTIVDPAVMKHPSIVAKIDNHEAARPQFGLSHTDLVFEELVEGGLTRYAAVWHSDVPETVGPVRSVRPMDPNIISSLGGLLAYSGGQARFVAMADAAPVKSYTDDRGSGFFRRTSGRSAPHNLVFGAAAAVKANETLAPPRAMFGYGVPLTSVPAATPASHIQTQFSSARYPAWAWDAATGAWLRSQEGAPDNDDTGARIHATNVLILRVGIDWRYSPVPDTMIVGSGEAVLANSGRTLHGTWSKASRDEPIVLKADDGSEMRLAPGNIWIELVPTTGSVTVAP
ncbi:MAG TPA: DUF3048 domain-containing protein [Candidatus Lumbricidophila sp.]|nr:DUF3048 domain-containing protein [Candidatus Lumbricidophila sp.]